MQEYNIYLRSKELDKGKKGAIIKEYAVHEGDTGSAEVQVALLTSRINQLAEHLKVHNHDFHTRRGLMMLIGQRKRLLTYVNNENVDRYRSLIKKLGLRK
jgi:small subunit ribosomal protein S15